MTGGRPFLGRKVVDKLEEPLRLRETDKVPYLSIVNWEDLGAKAVFSTRMGGVSQGEYAWLNLGLSTCDNPQWVQENRRVFWEALGVRRQDIAQTRQVHGSRVVLCETSGLYPETDGLVTSKPGVVLVGTFADCVPIYLFDPVASVVGLVHAGWRGSLSGVVLEALKLMVEAGAETSRCLVVVGPSIGQCCYGVDDTVIAPFRRDYPLWDDLVRTGDDGRYHLDLKEMNRRHLARAGVLLSRISVSGWCTSCNGVLFFSHRRDKGVTGRMVGAIWLTPSN